MRHTLALLIALLLAPLAALHAADAPKQTPNVIVILADDLGWADLGCYGSTFYETPNLDRLAEEGMRFSQAYASHSYCSPTRASLLTGRNPARLHITDYIPSTNQTGKYLPAEMNHALPLEEVTIAELLKDAGYVTWHVGKWHLGREGFYPEQQGFDINIAGNQSGLPASFFWPYGHNNPEAFKRYHGSPVPGLYEGGQEGEHLCDRLTSEAIGLIGNRDPVKPFFLYLPFYDVHTPIQAKPELIAKYTAKARALGLPSLQEAERVREGNPAQGSEYRDQMILQCNPTYAGMIETMDENVGRLMAKLDELGIAENTLVIFTSDNGGLNDLRATSNYPLRSGKGWLYEGGVRVPWIVKLPGLIRPGSVCELPVIAADISPTILDVCGLMYRPDLHLDGTSIMPLLKGKRKPIHEALYWHFPHYGNIGSGPCSSIRSENWKLIEWLENGDVELFDLARDESETKNLAAANPQKAEEMLRKLRDWRVKVGANMLREGTDETIREFRSRRMNEL